MAPKAALPKAKAKAVTPHAMRLAEIRERRNAAQNALKGLRGEMRKATCATNLMLAIHVHHVL